MGCRQTKVMQENATCLTVCERLLRAPTRYGEGGVSGVGAQLDDSGVIVPCAVVARAVLQSLVFFLKRDQILQIATVG